MHFFCTRALGAVVHACACVDTCLSWVLVMHVCPSAWQDTRACVVMHQRHGAK